MEDRLAALVAVTAHELSHLLPGVGSGERRTRHEERKAVEAFEAERESLLEEWSKPTARVEKPKKSRQEVNADRNAKLLAQWERKLKIAKTKVAKYRRKRRYYERAAASKGPSS